MTDANACPDNNILRQFLTGSLEATRSVSASTPISTPDASSAPIETRVTRWDATTLESHIERCGHCQQALESLVGEISSADTMSIRWVELVRGPATLPPPSPALDALMQRMVRQRREECEAETSSSQASLAPLSLDFLLPADAPGVLGRLGGYDILEVVGRGGMGIVFKAYDPALRRVVAIKVMAPHLASSATARRRFVREARAAAAVSHDHVVAIHAVEELHEPPLLVMQFVGGRTLHQRLEATGPLQLAEILRIGAQTAAGLAAAHAQGLVHRDIKPANILLENGVERVKITDFGLARAVDEAELTQTGMVAGTPQFMSPEQANGEPIDHRADLFSLGSVLYTLCTGHPPFRSTTTMGLLKRVCEETPRSIRESHPEFPEWLDAILAKLMAKRPDDRYQTAAEVAALFEHLLAELQRPASSARPAPRSAEQAVASTDESPGSSDSVRPSATTEKPSGLAPNPVAVPTPPRGPRRLWRDLLPQDLFRRLPLREVYPSRAQLALLFIWGLFMVPWLASMSFSLGFLEVLAVIVILLGILAPVVVVGVSWWQRRRVADWRQTLLGASPRRLLLFPTWWPFMLGVLFWSYRHATTGVIEFDVDDPQFAVTIMGPGIPRSQSYAANFHALRVLPGRYQWHVVTAGGSTPIQAGQVIVEPRRRSSLIVRSPYPLGHAELAFLPGRWELRQIGQSTHMPQVLPVDEKSPVEYLDVHDSLDIAIHSSRFETLIEQWRETTSTPATLPEATTRQNAETSVAPKKHNPASVEQSTTRGGYRLRASRASPTVRGWMRVDILINNEPARVVAHGILSADPHRLNLRLSPPNSPRVDSWGGDNSATETRTLIFERASDLALLQGCWQLDPSSSETSAVVGSEKIEVAQRELRLLANEDATSPSPTELRRLLAPVEGTRTNWSLSLPGATASWGGPPQAKAQPRRTTLTARLRTNQGQDEQVLLVECLYQVDASRLTLALGKPGFAPQSFDPSSPGTACVVHLSRCPAK